jgi:hypothetical protein
MKWLPLLVLVACRTQPLDVTGDGGITPAPDLSPVSCGGFAGIGCPPKQFCEMPAGQCFNDSTGTCAPIPSICGTVFDPVCGCDFVTYPNDCARQQAGVPLSFQGECEGPVDLAVVDLSRVPDLARPLDLAGVDFGGFTCGTQTCPGGEYCFIGCCGTPGCMPPPPTCTPLPDNCVASCSNGCLQNTGGCNCTEDAAGHFTVQCSLCP